MSDNANSNAVGSDSEDELPDFNLSYNRSRKAQPFVISSSSEDEDAQAAASQVNNDNTIVISSSSEDDDAQDKTPRAAAVSPPDDKTSQAAASQPVVISSGSEDEDAQDETLRSAASQPFVRRPKSIKSVNVQSTASPRKEVRQRSQAARQPANELSIGGPLFSKLQRHWGKTERDKTRTKVRDATLPVFLACILDNSDVATANVVYSATDDAALTPVAEAFNLKKVTGNVKTKQLHTDMCCELEQRLATLLAKSIYHMKLQGGKWPPASENHASVKWKIDKDSPYVYELAFNCVTYKKQTMHFTYTKRRVEEADKLNSVEIISTWPAHTPNSPGYTDRFEVHLRTRGAQPGSHVKSEWPVKRSGEEFDKEARISMEQRDIGHIKGATRALDPSGRGVAWNSTELDALDREQTDGQRGTFPRAICCIAGVLAVALRSLRSHAPDKYNVFITHLRSQGITALDTLPRVGQIRRTRVGVLCADFKTPLLAKWYTHFVSIVFAGSSIEDFEPVYVTEDFKTELAPGKRGLEAFAAAGGHDCDVIVSEHCPGLPETTSLVAAVISARLAVGGTFVAKNLSDPNFGEILRFIVHSHEFAKIYDNGTIVAYRRVERETVPVAEQPDRRERGGTFP
ncbi:MAG: hypothetical protein VW491_03120 [Gammaproteobacteria bacterium]